MADQINLAVEARSEFGKGAARRARRANLVPAVVYGHGAESVHINLPPTSCSSRSAPRTS